MTRGGRLAVVVSLCFGLFGPVCLGCRANGGGEQRDVVMPASLECDTSPPSIGNLIVDVSYNSVRFAFSCDEPCRVRVVLTRRADGRLIEVWDAVDIEHSIEVSPLYCFSEYDYSLAVQDSSGNSSEVSGSFSTPEYRSAFIAYQHIRGSSTSDFPGWLDMLAAEGFDVLEVGQPDLGYMRSFDYGHFIEHDTGVAKMATLVEMANERGFETLGVYWTFGAPPYDQQHAELYARDQDGEPLDWLCPANPLVKSLVMDVLAAYLDRLGLDGIVLDGIRYLDTYCLCDYHMSHADGEPGTLRWDEWCSDDLTGFVESVRDMLHERGKSLWAYVWSYNQRYHEWFWGTELFSFRGQDWRGWAERGSVDGLKNMDYYVGPSLLLWLTLQELAVVGSRVLWAPAFWFSHQESGVDTPEELEFVVSTMREFHISGYSVFDWTKVISRPNDFGWAHDTFMQLNASPR
ncbi:MAG TPA: hypothetical protein ENF73_00525 [Proteobacteria bacterium]|nr:hypothetical protein [Pseudomonadota bacterium]